MTAPKTQTPHSTAAHLKKSIEKLQKFRKNIPKIMIGNFEKLEYLSFFCFRGYERRNGIRSSGGTRSETATPVGSPKKRQLPVIPSVGSASHHRERLNERARLMKSHIDGRTHHSDPHSRTGSGTRHSGKNYTPTSLNVPRDIHVV